MYVCLYVCMYVCNVCMYVMYVMYVCMYIHIYGIGAMLIGHHLTVPLHSSNYEKPSHVAKTWMGYTKIAFHEEKALSFQQRWAERLF